MGIFESLGRSTRIQKMSVLKWTVAVVCVSLVPALLGSLGAYVWERDCSLSKFIMHGEAAIFSLGLLLGTISLTQREMRIPFPSKELLFWSAIALAFFAAGFYSVLTTGLLASGGATGETTPNLNAVLILSAIVYLGSIAVGAVVNLVHAVREHRNLEDLLSSIGDLPDVDLEKLLREPRTGLADAFQYVREVEDE